MKYHKNKILRTAFQIEVAFGRNSAGTCEGNHAHDATIHGGSAHGTETD